MSHSFSGARLRATREAAGFTHERLAIILAPSLHTVDAYERGEAAPPLHQLVRIAAALGVEPTDLFDEG
jgi:transcriptional regulator with XRE-family HTH domain